MNIDKEQKKLVQARKFINKLDELQTLALDLHYIMEEGDFKYQEFFECVFEGIFPENMDFDSWGMNISVCRDMAHSELDLQTEFVRFKKFELDAKLYAEKARESEERYQRMLVLHEDEFC
jgi:tRNA nucleotidyltransferase/poly(A) polymerase